MEFAVVMILCDNDYHARFIPKEKFDLFVLKHGADRSYKTFDSWTQLVTMLGAGVLVFSYLSGYFIYTLLPVLTVPLISLAVSIPFH
jgi:hypothetical protein